MSFRSTEEEEEEVEEQAEWSKKRFLHSQNSDARRDEKTKNLFLSKPCLFKVNNDFKR